MLPQTGALYRFWRDVRRGRPLPRRADLGPEALRPWLGSLSLYERTEDGADFRIRLDGTKIVALTGEDRTGRRVSEIDRRSGSDALACCLDVCRRRLPLLDSALPLFRDRRRFAQRLLLPVSRDGEEAHQVLMALFALDVDPSDRPGLRNRRLMLPG